MPTRRALGLPSTSLPLEDRLTLFQERTDALGVVVAETQFTHQVAFQIELGIQAVAQALLNGPFGVSQPLGGRAREMRGQCGQTSLQAAIGRTFPEEPPSLRPTGRTVAA